MLIRCHKCSAEYVFDTTKSGQMKCPNCGFVHGLNIGNDAGCITVENCTFESSFSNAALSPSPKE